MPRHLIQCVVVLYRKAPVESLALNSLARIYREDSGISEQFSVLIYDNSPNAQEVAPELLGEWEQLSYHHNPDNPGLAAAYNMALLQAEAADIPWLVLLDQDTVLNRDYIQELIHAIAKSRDSRIRAFIPKLCQAGRILSPHRMGLLRHPPVDANFEGPSVNRLTAFNSGACLRVDALRSIEGFPPEFPLDYLDHIIFHRLQQGHGRIFVLGSRLDHQHSLVDIEREMSVQRYAGLLLSESRYTKEARGRIGKIFYRLQLLERGILQFVRLGDKRYAQQTFQALWRT